jgi:hypothetical protein
VIVAWVSKSERMPYVKIKTREKKKYQTTWQFRNNQENSAQADRSSGRSHYAYFTEELGF